MDSRVQIAVFAALISVALAAQVYFRKDRERLHRAFAAFALAVAGLQTTTVLTRLSPSPDRDRFRSIATIAVAWLAMQFFRAFVREPVGRSHLLARGATIAALLVLVVLASPFHGHVATVFLVAAFVLLSFYTTLASLHRHRLATRSRRDAERVRFLTITGGIAGLLTLADYLPPFGDVDIGSTASVFLIVFLYMLSQAVVRERMLDLYDLAGRAAVLTTLALFLAATLFLLGRITGARSFAHAFVAALVVLLLLEPLRAGVERWTRQLFFFDRYELELALTVARARIATEIDPGSIATTAADALEGTGRVTHAAVYFVESDGRSLALASHVGPQPPSRLEPLALRPLLDRLARDGSVVLESLERELERLRRRGDDRDAETVFEIVQHLGALHASVVIALRSDENDTVGLLTIHDERMRDAFAHDEISLLVGLGLALGAAFGRSVQYRSAKERDRLVALGEMSAGLAHEIRNPLGAIKATAQLLTDTRTSAVDGEFLDIIVDEVDRLNRVVEAFLDYARPSHSEPSSCDPVSTIERTVQLLAAEPLAAGPTLALEVERDVPEVSMDAERLRQVVWNLARNALEALAGKGALRIRVGRADAHAFDSQRGDVVEIAIEDDGPGIDESVRPHLFVPFVTSKAKGTGLGLAMSHRLVASAGGRIDVRSERGRGTTFTIRLPIAGVARPVDAER